MSSRGTRYWSTGAIPLIAPDLLGDIIATASDIAIVISDVGQILSILVNPNHRSFGKLSHWENRDIRYVLTGESVPKLDAVLARCAREEENLDAIELNHADGSTWEFPIRYSFHRVGPDGALLMLGRDLRPIAEMQQQLVRAQLALETDYESQRDYDTRFRVIMETSREGMVFVALGTGRVLDLNRAAASLLGVAADDTIGQPFAGVFEPGPRKADLLESLSSAALADTVAPQTLQSRRSGLSVSVVPKLFRAAGERMMLCRIEPAEAAEAVPDSLSEGLAGLFAHGSDGIVFTSLDGQVIVANEAFLSLVDATHLSMVQGKALGEFLARGTVDTKVLIENAQRNGHMRLYATKVSGQFGGALSVEISVTYLKDPVHPSLVFVIRDCSRAEAMRKPNTAVTDEGVRSVMELVGSASLREIVTETTDVVEKMCIETAIELTRNNRVAAAEMLGLSRQSLYVKLRKYDLLSRDPD